MKNLRVTLTIVFGLFLCQTAFAQTIISNIPATDVIEKKDFYAEVNFGAHFGKYENGGFQAYGIKTLYGVSRDLEIGANIAYTKTGEISPIEFAPNVKWKAYSNEKHKVAVVGGAMTFVPVRAEKGSRPIGLIYANASKGFNAAKGFRLTGGVYSIVGAKAESGNRKGVMFGYEHRLHKNVSLFADWASGKNRFGYSAVGLSIPLTKRDMIYSGYNFGNRGRGNNWFAITYGRFF